MCVFLALCFRTDNCNQHVLTNIEYILDNSNNFSRLKTSRFQVPITQVPIVQAPRAQVYKLPGSTCS